MKTIDIEGKKIKMQIWDTAGQEKYKSIVTTFYKGAMGIVIVYSSHDQKSFYDVEIWMQQIEENTSPDIPKVLIANKSDLEDNKITYEEGKALADKYELEFFETSAKLGKNVYEPFYKIAGQIKRKIDESAEKGQRVDSGVTLNDQYEENGNRSGGCC